MKLKFLILLLVIFFPQFAKAKLAIGALTEASDVIAPTVLIQPGTATDARAEGIPKDSPPKPDTNPNGPANTPVPAFSLPKQNS